MGDLGSLLEGFQTVLSPTALLFAAVGVTLGTLVGVMPGIGPAVTIALLLPVATQFDDPIPAFIMFAGIYYGAMYGGSTTSILLNTPGESASVATAIEGNLMARRGEARAALATAAIGSFVAALISTVLLALVAEPAASAAVSIQATSYVAIMILALATVTALVGKSVVRGLISLMIGMMFAIVGLDPQSGQTRFTFGSTELFGGIEDVLIVIGLFAVGEVLYVLSRRQEHEKGAVLALGERGRGFLWLTRDQWRRSWGPWLRGAGFGFPFGAMPSGGAELPTFLSYSYEKNRSRGKDEFGTGAIEGVAGPEAANNASFTGVLVPLLTLGIPTSATAAVMIAAFKQFNIQPGPQLFTTSGDLVWALIASLFVGNVLLLILNLPLINVWVKVLSVPTPVLYSGILVFASLGIYASSGNATQVTLSIAIGVLGFFMRKLDFPIAPTILGAILATEMERQFRRAMVSSNDDLSVFWTRPVTVVILVLAVAAFALPHVPRLMARARGGRGGNRLSFGDED